MNMKTRSNEPIVWLLFGAGGVVVAFILPMLIFLTGIAGPLGWLPQDAFSYDRMAAVLANPFGKIFVFLLIVLCLWHGFHRMLLSLRDLRIHERIWHGWLFYGLAGVLSVVTLVLVLLAPTGG